LALPEKWSWYQMAAQLSRLTVDDWQKQSKDFGALV
jgi:hypothetical protein